MLGGSCHCGAVHIEVPRKPRVLTLCNCSICRRYGTLWAYFNPKNVRIRRNKGSEAGYAWGDKSIRFARCSTCGCVTHYETTTNRPRWGVNMRMFAPELLDGVKMELFDGADTWKVVTPD
jgi:hypothetical protein